MYEEMTASSLIKIDSAGRILSKPAFVGADYGVNRAGFVIHGAAHDAKPDIACVIHTHRWAGMALSTLKCGLLPITQTAMRFVHIGYHDYKGVVLDMAERDALVNDLGDHNALIFRNHGLLTVGHTISEAFNAMHRLELSCKSQLAALACGVEHHRCSREGARRDVYELSAANASALWLAGVARAAVSMKLSNP